MVQATCWQLHGAALPAGVGEEGPGEATGLQGCSSQLVKRGGAWRWNNRPHKVRTPLLCTRSGITFSNIYVEVDYKEIPQPAWRTEQEQPACGSKAVLVDDTTVRLEWDASSPAPPAL